MMHNLGLGGLEFSPNHSIEEHHQAGYRVYEEGLTADGEATTGELKETKSPHLFHFEPSTTTERSLASTNHILEIQIQNDGENSEEIVLVKETQQRKDLRNVQEEITVRVKSEGANANHEEEASPPNEPQTFISMHDPKHRHPSFRGECISLAIYYHLLASLSLWGKQPSTHQCGLSNLTD